MAVITTSDVVNIVKEKVGTRYAEMPNTKFAAESVLTAAKFTQERMASARQIFNNQSTSHIAQNGSLFRGIFKSIDSKKSELKGSEDEFVSSGTKEENEGTENTASRPSLSADTISRNQTAYDVAGIQVKAIVTQTAAISNALTDQKTVLENINTNIGKLLSAVDKGFSAMDNQYEESAQAQEMYTKQGYLKMDAYFKQIQEQTASQMAILKPLLNTLTNPKELVGFAVDALLDTKALKTLTGGIEETLSKTFTNTIEKFSSSKFLNQNNLISNALRSIFKPQGKGGDYNTTLNAAAGIEKRAAAQFDNITHRTINDVIPGLLERILTQNELTTSILQKNTGITGISSGVTYDMKSGRFVARSDIQAALQQRYQSISESNSFHMEGNAKVTDDINLNAFADYIQPIVFTMASKNIEIAKFAKCDLQHFISWFAWGMGRHRLGDGERQNLERLWAVFNTEMSMNKDARRRAMQQINVLYNNIKRELDKQHENINKELQSGILRNDQIGDFHGWNALDIKHGNVIEDKLVKIKGNRENSRTSSDDGFGSYGDIISEGIGDLASVFMQTKEDLKEVLPDLKSFAQQGLKQGSIYVHDSVAVEYLKAIAGRFGAIEVNSSGISAAEHAHGNAHPDEKGSSSAAQTAATAEKAIKAVKLKDVYGEEAAAAVAANGSNTSAALAAKQKAMELGQKAGFIKGSNDVSGDGYYDKIAASERTQILNEIERAARDGVLTMEEKNDLIATINRSSPEEYKNNTLKRIARFAPVVIGGLAGGPYGALIGLGVRKVMKRTTADNVHDKINKAYSASRKEAHAKKKHNAERAEVERQIQELWEQGKITTEEAEEARQALNTSTDEEYKGGLMKWAKRLGPIAALGLLGVSGPLAILGGAFIGKKLTQTTASKVKKGIHKAKPNEQLWDDGKRQKLLDQIDKKIEEAELLKTGDLDPDKQAQVDAYIAKLSEYREDIVKAGRTKGLWYVTSLPGLLTVAGKLITSIPRGIGKLGSMTWAGVKFVGNKLVRGLDSASNWVVNKMTNKDGAIGAIGRTLGSAKHNLGKFFRNMGTAATFFTGKAHKKNIANANRAVAEVSRLLQVDPNAASAEALSGILQNVAGTNDAFEKFLEMASGHSVSTSDQTTHALLKHIVAKVNPDADLSDVSALEGLHSSETGSTPVKSTASAGKDTSSAGQQNPVVTGTAIATSADADDENALATYEKGALEGAKTEEQKQKIKKVFTDTKANMKNKKKDKDGEEGILSKILGVLKSGGGVLAGISSALIGIGGTLGGAYLGGKLAADFGKSFTEDIDTDVETRRDHVKATTTTDATAAVAGASVMSHASKALTSLSKVDDVGAAIKGSVAFQKVSEVAGNIGGSSFVKGITGAASFVAGKIGGSSVVKSITGSAAYTKIKGWLEPIKNFLGGKIGGAIGKLTEKFMKNDVANKICKKIFSGAGNFLKKAAKVLGAIGFVLDVLARLVKKISDADPDYLEKMSAGMSSKSNIVEMILYGINYTFDTAAKLAQNGDDGLFEMIVKSVVGAGVENILMTSFPVYAIIKCCVALISLGLDAFIDGRDKEFLPLRMFQFFCDDLLQLDSAVIQGIADVLVDVVELIISLFSFSGAKIKEKLGDVVSTIGGFFVGGLKAAALVFADLILIFAVSNPIIYGILKLIGLADDLLALRMRFTHVLDGEISLWDFLSGKNTETNGNDIDTSNIGAGRGRGYIYRHFGRGSNVGGDLYQENPMYRNSPYDMFNSGCGPIALTAALRKQGISTNPNVTAANLSGYRVADGGTMPQGILDIGNAMGGRFQAGSPYPDDILASARSGKPVVMMGQGNAFGSGMHYMTAVGASGNNLLVRDPLSPSLRSIPAEQLGNVSDAIYGRGGGRGVITDGFRAINSFGSNLIGKVGELFGGLFGNSSSSDNAGTSPASVTNAGFVTESAVPATGTVKSVDGKVIYPDEMRKDPSGKFPYDGHMKYSEMLPAVKDLLIAQYKYTKILPSVIACIMRGETSFGQNAHEKNLGNIKKTSISNGGTKNVTNVIYDSQEGSRDDYEAYQYWGESIYRIGNFIATISRYSGAVGNKDTLTSLLAIAAGGYATAGNWATSLYNFWKAEDMNTLKTYDQLAFDTLKNAKTRATAATRNGPQIAAYGRGGFADAMVGLSSLGTRIMSGVSSLFGLNGSSSDTSGSSFGDSGASMSMDPSVAHVSGSFGERMFQYLQQNYPGVTVSSEYGSTDPVHGGDPHEGVDFAAPEGTPIYAPTDGTITKRVNTQIANAKGSTGEVSMGNHIRLLDAQGRSHYFLHMKHDTLTGVTEVHKGDYLGQVGNTGNSTGPHLHYQVTRPNSTFHDEENPFGIAGYGRKGGKGGPVDVMDYTELLQNIFVILKQIATNTGALNAIGGSGRRSSSPIKPGSKLATAVPGVGSGYQRIARGY